MEELTMEQVEELIETLMEYEGEERETIEWNLSFGLYEEEVKQFILNKKQKEIK